MSLIYLFFFSPHWISDYFKSFNITLEDLQYINRNNVYSVLKLDKKEDIIVDAVNSWTSITDPNKLGIDFLFWYKGVRYSFYILIDKETLKIEDWLKFNGIFIEKTQEDESIYRKHIEGSVLNKKYEELLFNLEDLIIHINKNNGI